MLNLIISFMVAMLAACHAPTKPESSESSAQAAPPARTPRTAVVYGTPVSAQSGKTVRVVRANGQPINAQSADDEDEDDGKAHTMTMVAELDDLEELDSTISDAIEQAMAAQGLAKDQIREALKNAHSAYAQLGGNTGWWRMNQPEVEYDENAAFFGVSTEPVNPQTAAQLPITRGTGLVLTMIEEGSPAATGGLKQMDVVSKLDDQMLVNAQQFAVLLRAHKPGDEVKVSFLRGGKEQTVNVKLGSRKLPKLGPGGNRADGGWDADSSLFLGPDMKGGNNALMQKVYANNDALRDKISRARVMTTPGYVYSVPAGSPAMVAPAYGAATVHGADEVDSGNMALNYSSDEASVEYRAKDGKVHLTVKDVESDETVFDQDREPTKDELNEMRPEVRKQVERLLKDLRGGGSGKPGVLRVPRTPTPPPPPAAPAPPPAPSPSVSPDEA